MQPSGCRRTQARSPFAVVEDEAVDRLPLLRKVPAVELGTRHPGDRGGRGKDEGADDMHFIELE